jgi:hypothetical protein
MRSIIPACEALASKDDRSPATRDESGRLHLLAQASATSGEALRVDGGVIERIV